MRGAHFELKFIHSFALPATGALLISRRLPEVVLLAHSPIPVKTYQFTPVSTWSCAYPKGIFLFDFVEVILFRIAKPT